MVASVNSLSSGMPLQPSLNSTTIPATMPVLVVLTGDAMLARFCSSREYEVSIVVVREALTGRDEMKMRCAKVRQKSEDKTCK